MQYMVIRSDHMGQYMLTMWTAWIDAIYGETWWPHGAIYTETRWPCEPHESMQYMVIRSDHMGQYTPIHGDHVNGMNQCNIWWDTLTTWAIYRDMLTMWTIWINAIYRYMLTIWTIWINAICRDTLWPHGHYMVIHSDHVDNTNQCDMSRYTMTTWGQSTPRHSGYVDSTNQCNMSRYTMTTWDNQHRDMGTMWWYIPVM